MARLNLNIRPIMSQLECRRIFNRPRTEEFGAVIVYLPRYQRADGTYTSDNGRFQEFDMHMTFWGTGQDDWHLDEDMTENDFGTFVKSLYVSFDQEEYYEAFLYSRVRKSTPYALIRDVLYQLNKHLNMFKDDLRTGIAQEWAAQEPWKVMPRFKSGCIQTISDGDGRVLTFTSPVHNIVAVMNEHLPRGYGEDLPASDIIP